MSVLASTSDRLGAERGFTLIELLVACTIGVLIILGADALLDTSITLTGRVSDRVDSAERARLAMTQMTRELRSQVCFQDASGNPQPSILPTPRGLPTPTTGDYSMTFYEYIGSSSNPGGYTPQEVTLSWNSDKTITETDYAGSGTPPNVSFPAAPTERSTLLTNVVPVATSLGQSLPVFSYYQYGGSKMSTTPLATPLTSSTVGSIAAIEVRFVARANNRSDNRQSTTLDELAFVPGWDPNAPGAASPPECL